MLVYITYNVVPPQSVNSGIPQGFISGPDWFLLDDQTALIDICAV